MFAKLTASDRMAAHRKSDQHRVYRYVGGLRKHASAAKPCGNKPNSRIEHPRDEHADDKRQNEIDSCKFEWNGALVGLKHRAIVFDNEHVRIKWRR
jgi:hypothetical protein